MPVRLDQEKEGINTEMCSSLVSYPVQRNRGDMYFMLWGVKGVNMNGVWIGEWNFDHLCTPFGNASNYSAIADLHTLQIATH
jgi:hypothetical protein